MDLAVLDQLEQQAYLKWTDLLKSSAGSVFQQLAQQLNTTQARQIIWHARTGAAKPACACGQPVEWHADLRRYRDYCSRACTARYSVTKKKQKNLQTLGVEWHSQTAEWSAKVKSTSRLKWGCDHYSQTAEFEQRTTATCQENFGVAKPAQSPVVQQRIRRTVKDRYGVDNVSQRPESKAAQTATNQARYGVDNVATRHISVASWQFLNDPVQLSAACQQFTVREIAAVHGISVKPIYDRIRAWGIELPAGSVSTMERQVLEWVSQHYSGIVVAGDRSLLQNRQIDIWLPQLSLAIECNGTYWHSELQGRGADYHLNKTLGCVEQGISLMHIWEHDWIQRQSIVKSMLLYRLGLCHRIGARVLKLVSLPVADCREFMIANHLQGWAQGAKFCTALVDAQGQVMAAMTFGRDRFGRTDSWELLRFAVRSCYAVVGAAGRLFRHFCQQHNPSSVISYSDRGVTTGAMYTAIGFELSHYSRPNYRYTQDYMTFYSRNLFQKHKLGAMLSRFDPNQTEWQNMQSNGWDRMWDCGNAVYKWWAHV